MSISSDRVGASDIIFPLAYEIERGEPDRRYRRRLDEAADLAGRHGLPVWCLGGHPGWLEHSCAWYAKRYLVRRGISHDAIRTIDDFSLLGESLDTTQEVLAAIELARRTGVRRLIVISDLLHLAQVRLMLRGVGIEAVWVPTSLGPVTTMDDIRYVVVRLAMLVLTLLDRRGRTLGWLRHWRRDALGPMRRRVSPAADPSTVVLPEVVSGIRPRRP